MEIIHILTRRSSDLVLVYGSDKEIVLLPIIRGSGSNYWPVLDWAWEIMVQDRFILNIIHMKNFFHQIRITISVAQSVCKAIQQGPGTGWLPSDIKNYWHRNFWKKLEGLQACPTWSEVTSAEWLIREAGYTLWNDEYENKSIMGTRCVYNWTNMMVGMGLDNILHNDREPCHARIFNAWIEDWESDILRTWYQEIEQRLLQKYKNIRFLDDEDNQTYIIDPENLEFK